MIRSLLMLVTIALFVNCSNAQEGGEIRDVSVEEAKAMLSRQPDIQIIDVRTDEECEGGMIENARQMDISDSEFAQRIEKLDREGTYLVYCKAGGRSRRAQNMMKDMGFHRVYNLNGGYSAWSAAK